MDPRNGASALKRDLPHLEEKVDFVGLSRHIGWVTWEEICEVLSASPIFCSSEFPHAELKTFFRERCLWPAGAGYSGQGMQKAG